MRHLTLAILPLVLLTALPAQAQMITISPEQIGQIFCIGSLGNDMAPVEALLTPDLAAVIADAWVKDAQAESANPGDKPPLGDGIPWRSYPDYADGCEAFEGLTDADVAFVEISYSFASEPSANYTNTLVLKPIIVTDGMEPFWRIDDIDLGEGNTLRSALAAAFAY
jgi:hypothetical protein